MKKSVICIFLAITILFSACGKIAVINTEVNLENENSTVTDAGYENIESQSDSSALQSSSEKDDKTTAEKDSNTKIQTTAANNNIGKIEDISDVLISSDTVSLYINCSNAVAYGIRDNEAYKKIIPENGVVFSSANIEITDGESVMSLLKRTLKANKIVYQITSGGYVKSINGLSEFDCGSNSGWLYKVNELQPNVSSKSYKLSAGDKVEFIYTCKNGDV